MKVEVVCMKVEVVCMKVKVLVEYLYPGRWLTNYLKGNPSGPCCLCLVRIVDVSEPRDRYRHSVDVQVILKIDSLASTSTLKTVVCRTY